MDDAELLKRELRAAREELIRKRSQCTGRPDETESRLPLMPDREEAFLRLALMSVEELEAHVERLERDLADLEQGIDAPDE
jgi:polyhydroxyalkanoate synthesis regulator phasin